jgi:uncharacterized protein VirK/YbjX
VGLSDLYLQAILHGDVFFERSRVCLIGFTFSFGDQGEHLGIYQAAMDGHSVELLSVSCCIVSKHCYGLFAKQLICR